MGEAAASIRAAVSIVELLSSVVGVVGPWLLPVYSSASAPGSIAPLAVDRLEFFVLWTSLVDTVAATVGEPVTVHPFMENVQGSASERDSLHTCGRDGCYRLCEDGE